jgi:hypothetical protein
MVSLSNTDVRFSLRRHLADKTTFDLLLKGENRKKKIANGAMQTRNASSTVLGNVCRGINNGDVRKIA